MEQKSRIERLVRLTRPNAKFVNVSHSNDFTDPTPELGQGYYYVNLYDEKIDSLLNKTKDGQLYLIHNTYLSSFAYNLYLCLFYCQHTNIDLTIKGNPLLNYNFKKFFAEQLYTFNNNIFSRAILLETLLYEQEMMIPVFEQKKINKLLNEYADFASNIMSNLVSFHELGHYILEVDKIIWSSILKEHNDTVGILYSTLETTSSSILLEEFKCDVIAVLSCINQYKNEYNIDLILKSILFGFSSYAVLSSLVKSAEATSIEHKKLIDDVDFLSIEKRNRDYVYTIGIDRDFVFRTNLMVDLCKLIGEKENVNLFSKGMDISIPETLLEDMLSIIDVIMESNDDNARNMSLLVAESLHNHPKGMEFLYLRSKVFEGNRELKL